jgi:hypothetical protein
MSNYQTVKRVLKPEWSEVPQLKGLKESDAPIDYHGSNKAGKEASLGRSADAINRSGSVEDKNFPIIITKAADGTPKIEGSDPEKTKYFTERLKEPEFYDWAVKVTDDSKGKPVRTFATANTEEGAEGLSAADVKMFTGEEAAQRPSGLAGLLGVEQDAALRRNQTRGGFRGPDSGKPAGKGAWDATLSGTGKLLSNFLGYGHVGNFVMKQRDTAAKKASGEISDSFLGPWANKTNAWVADKSVPLLQTSLAGGGAYLALRPNAEKQMAAEDAKKKSDKLLGSASELLNVFGDSSDFSNSETYKKLNAAGGEFDEQLLRESWDSVIKAHGGKYRNILDTTDVGSVMDSVFKIYDDKLASVGGKVHRRDSSGKSIKKQDGSGFETISMKPSTQVLKALGDKGFAMAPFYLDADDKDQRVGFEADDKQRYVPVIRRKPAKKESAAEKATSTSINQGGEVKKDYATLKDAMEELKAKKGSPYEIVYVKADKNGLSGEEYDPEGKPIKRNLNRK